MNEHLKKRLYTDVKLAVEIAKKPIQEAQVVLNTFIVDVQIAEEQIKQIPKKVKDLIQK